MPLPTGRLDRPSNRTEAIFLFAMRTKILGLCGIMVCAVVWGWANQPPCAQTTVIFAEPNKPVNLTLLAEDPDGDHLSFELLDTARFGELLGSPPHLVYRPNKDFEGTERLSFRVIDPYGAFDVGFVEIRVSRDATALRIIPQAPRDPSFSQLVEFLVQQGVQTWYIVDLEPRAFRPGVLPFIFATPHFAAKLFVVGPLAAPEIRSVAAGQSYAFAVDLQHAAPGTYFFLAIDGNQAFSYPFRIIQPEQGRVLAHAG